MKIFENKNNQNYNLIGESKTSTEILMSEISNYIKKVKKELPAEVVKIIQLTQDLGIIRKTQIEKIIQASKAEVSTTLYKELGLDKNVSPETGGDSYIKLYDIWALLRSFKDKPTKLKMLPQYQSKAEREALEAGKLSMNDLTLDFSTPQGRNAAAKIYMPLVIKIVNQFIGKSKLSKAELLSAGTEGMTKAMNLWDPTKENATSFKQLLAYQVRFQILNDMSEFGHTFSGTHQNSQKLLDKKAEKGKYAGSLDAFSLDALTNNLDGDFKQDYLSALATQDDEASREEYKEQVMKKGSSELVKLVDQALSQRDAEIVYSYFGMNGYKKMKGKDIAAKYGVSNGFIQNGVIKKLYDKIMKVKGANEILLSLRDAYMENLMLDIYKWDNKQSIIEKIEEDPFVEFIYEATKFMDKDNFYELHNEAIKYLKDKDIIEEILNGDFKTADLYVKTYRDSIVLYLNSLYNNQEDFSNATEVELIEQLVALQNLVQNK